MQKAIPRVRGCRGIEVLQPTDKVAETGGLDDAGGTHRTGKLASGFTNRGGEGAGPWLTTAATLDESTLIGSGGGHCGVGARHLLRGEKVRVNGSQTS